MKLPNFKSWYLMRSGVSQWWWDYRSLRLPRVRRQLGGRYKMFCKMPMERCRRRIAVVRAHPIRCVL